MRFTILGPVAAHEAGTALELGPPKQRAVLAMLLLDANRVVPLDRIIEDLWRGEPPPRALAAVHAYVSVLRRLLEPDRAPRGPASRLVSRAPGYFLRVAPLEVDALEFEALLAEGRDLLKTAPAEGAATIGAALALWQGPLAADFASEAWVAGAAARFGELRAVATEDRFDALLTTGHSDIVAELEEALAEHPLRERLWGQLIVALYRSGRQGDALRAYQRARSVLADELGVEPGPELQALEADVLGHSAALDPPSATRPRAHLAVAPEDGIVGRDAELAALRHRLDDVRDGIGGAVAVTGAAGVGKTRLVEVALEDAPGIVAWGRCVAGEAAPALWPWLQIAGGLVDGGDDLSDALRPPADTAQTSDPADRAAVYARAVEAVVRAAGTTPLAIVVDDAQWADAASHHIIQLLLSRLGDVPLLLVLTVREHEQATPELGATLAALARDRRSERIRLGGLDEPAIAAQLTARYGVAPSAAAVRLLHERTGGNAFYLTEILRLLSGPDVLDDADAVVRIVPQSVRDVVVRRVAQLPATAGLALAAASVLGREFDQRVLAAMTGLDQETCFDILDVATVSGFLEAGRTATRHQFTHDLVREAIYGELPAARRRSLHAQALRHLDAHYGGDAAHLNELASQAWLGRGALDGEEVVRRLMDAAAGSSAAIAYEQAEQHLRHALEASEDITDVSYRDRMVLDASVRVGRLMRFVHGGEAPETVAAFRRVRELESRTATSSIERARVLSELADDDILAGNLLGAVERANEIVAVGTGSDDVVAESSGRFKLATAAFFLGRLAVAAEELNLSQELLRQRPDDDRMSMLGIHPLPTGAAFLATVLHMQGDLAGASAAAADAVDLCERFGNRANAALITMFGAFEAVIDLDVGLALERSERYSRMAAALGMSLFYHQASVVSGWALGRQGDVQEGLRRIRLSGTALAALSARPLVLSGAFLESDVLLADGDPEGALAAVAPALEACVHTREGLFLPELLRVQGGAYAALGDRESARAAYAASVDVAREQAAQIFVQRSSAAARMLDAPTAPGAKSR